MKKKTVKRAILLSLIGTVLFAGVIFSVITIAGYAKTAKEDYSAKQNGKGWSVDPEYRFLTCDGVKYVPLPLPDGVGCLIGDVIESDPYVEGNSLLDDLIDGNMIQEVKGDRNGDIVFLHTDFDHESKYYCTEEKLEYYRDLAKNGAYDEYAAEIITEDWNYYLVTLDERIVECVNGLSENDLSKNVDSEWARYRGDEEIEVYTVVKGSPFRRYFGSLMQKNGEYYWLVYKDTSDAEDYEDPDQNDHADVYVLPDGLDKLLDDLFDEMFK